MALAIHLFAALGALLAGASQLVSPKGTKLHKVVGWFWMGAMVTVAVSSFWLTGLMDVIWGYSPIHILSLWTLFCVAASLYFVKTGNIRRHRGFAVGAFIGVVGAGLGTLLPGRLVGQWLFG
ncbi:DUF2306 domain-containing protein [Marinimicrobium locisalis]|uniref:DUF2306 domain-containing protein n=1 Tax=Marinimicrobium locisalis TaxID=546022 RepID=UPI003221D297